MRLTRELRGEHEHIADAHARVGEARVDPHAPSGITSIGLLNAQPYSLPLPLTATASSNRLLHAASLTPTVACSRDLIAAWRERVWLEEA